MKKIICIIVLLIAGYNPLYSQEVSNKNKEVIIFWDTSLSMLDRDIEKDISFLEDYLQFEAISKAKVIVFNTTVIQNQEFNLLGTNYDALQEFLRSSVYDGNTNYDLLNIFIKQHQESLFFTDNLSGKNLNATGFIVNSRKSNSNDFFEVLNKDLGVIPPIYLAKYVGIHNNSNTKTLNKDPNIKEINYSGMVYEDDFPLSKIKIILNKKDTIFSGIKGGFELKAIPGDVLVFENNIKRQLAYTLTKQQYLNVVFKSDAESLDEVIIKGALESEPVLKKTAYGLINEDRVGYAVQSMSNKEIPKTAVRPSEMLQGKFSGVTYGANQDLSQVVIRGGSNSLKLNNYGLIVIDGVPMPRSDSGSGGRINSTGHIDPNNIESITVLKGLAATNQYGTLGNNGVLLITSKTGTFSKGKKKELKVMNNNVYDDTKLKINKGKKSIPYIQELSKFKKVNEAYTYYLTQRLEYLDKAHYFLDVSKFFRPSNRQLANTIISNVLELFPDDLAVLRSLAYNYEESNDVSSALEVYQKILVLNEKAGQANVDLIQSLIANKNYEKAFELFLKITDESAGQNTNFSGISKTITNDFKNFMRLHNMKLKAATSSVPSKYTYNTKYDARIVVKWNNPNAEFVIQFVNPIKRFITWEHTLSANRSRIDDELQKGYFTEEFHINGEIKELKGKWLLNLKDLGNSSIHRIFLRLFYIQISGNQINLKP